jgi:hypothetical protein
MFIRACAALIGLALVTAPAWAVSAQPPRESNKRDAGAQETGKQDPPQGVEAKVVKVDAAKMTAMVELAGGRRQEIRITEKTKFIGPRGGVSDQGIKDDRFVAGAEVRLVLDAAGRTATEVHLPYRKSEDKPDKDK